MAAEPDSSVPTTASRAVARRDGPPEGYRKVEALVDDPPISGQSWVCLSFVSPPEEMMDDKRVFFLNRFLVEKVNQQIRGLGAQLAKEVNNRLNREFMELRNRLRSSTDTNDHLIAEHLKDIEPRLRFAEDDLEAAAQREFELKPDELRDAYQIFHAENQEELESEFREMQPGDYKPITVRGVKIRGSFREYTDAKARAQMLRDEVEGAHNIYVAPVGSWLPWDPNPDAIQETQYALDELNTLMQRYHDNVHQRNRFVHQRVAREREAASRRSRETVRERMRRKQLERQRERRYEELQRARRADEEDDGFEADGDGEGETPEQRRARLARELLRDEEIEAARAERHSSSKKPRKKKHSKRK